MKHVFFLGFAALSSAGAVAQNTAVITQQGGPHEVSIVQQGPGNTSVVNQSTGQTGNRVSLTQSGSGNVASINQGNGTAVQLVRKTQCIQRSQAMAKRLLIRLRMAIPSAFISQVATRLIAKRNQPKRKQKNNTEVNLLK